MKNQINAAALATLNSLHAEAIVKEIRATDALRIVLEKHPKINRVEFRHTAEAVGINGLTARNTFDRLTRG